MVTQVLRKRYFRPTKCYVELQFTESSPNFWGIELLDSASGQPDARQSEELERVQSAQLTADHRSAAKPLPTPQEVEMLRQEVNRLRDQLTSLSQTGAPGRLPDPASTAAAPVEDFQDVPPALASSPGEAPHRPSASRLPIDPEEITPAIVAPESAPEPYSTVRKSRPTPRPPNLQVASNSFTRILPLAAGFLLFATGAAWYVGLLPGLPAPKSSAALLPWSARATNPATPAPSVAFRPVDTPPETAAPKTPPATSPASTPSAATVKSSASQVPEVENATPEVPTEPSKKNIAVVNIARRSPRTSVKETSSATARFNEPDVVPPKLLSSVQGIAPPEAVLGFVAGNVVVDAVVGTSGRVISSTVVSGRPSLRPSALETVKQYRYQPATRNGRAVAAHVTITVKCWFEP